jgi:hypothetical protein
MSPDSSCQAIESQYALGDLGFGERHRLSGALFGVPDHYMAMDTKRTQPERRLLISMLESVGEWRKRANWYKAQYRMLRVNDHEQVVEIVGHAPCELAHCLYLLCLAKLLFKALVVGDVIEHALHNRSH